MGTARRGQQLLGAPSVLAPYLLTSPPAPLAYKCRPVIATAKVRMDSPVMQTFRQLRGRWALRDCYRCPGPIQVCCWRGGGAVRVGGPSCGAGSSRWPHGADQFAATPLARTAWHADAFGWQNLTPCVALPNPPPTLQYEGSGMANHANMTLAVEVK